MIKFKTIEEADEYARVRNWTLDLKSLTIGGYKLWTICNHKTGQFYFEYR